MALGNYTLPNPSDPFNAKVNRSLNSSSCAIPLGKYNTRAQVEENGSLREPSS